MSLNEIIKVERAFWEASGDDAFYRDHVDDDGTFVLPMGVMDKADVVEAMTYADAWESYEINEPTHVVLADGVEAVAYSAKAERGSSELYRANILSVYRRTGDDWRLVLHQQTPEDED